MWFNADCGPLNHYIDVGWLRKQADMLKEALPKPPSHGKGSKGAGSGTTLLSCLQKGMEREILAEAEA